jgi:hypothetical protein
MSTQLEIRLWPKRDRNGEKYLIGSAQNVPALVDLREATFLVFYPPDEDDSDNGGGNEEAHEEGRPRGPHATLIIRRDPHHSRRG